jgi:hypothetical protein
MTSVSEVVWKIAPVALQRRCNVIALVMLPLCATAKAAAGELGEERLHIAHPSPPVVE